jgi:AcrR family transcriptional regulator/predicted DNA-binding transcriptional regulator AlpA
MEYKDDRPLRISELEKIAGIKRSTIHYYVRVGLLSPPRRTGKTMAYYYADHVGELRRIRELQDDGYPISLIKEMKDDSKGWKEAAAEEHAAPGDRKQQIMEKAVEVFARKGYHNTRISDIAKAAGVGHSTFYLYFPTKEAMFIECVDQVFQAMFSGVWEEIKHEKNPLKRLRMRGEAVLQYHPEFLDILHVLHGTMEDDPRLEAMRKEIYASIAKTVQRDINKAIKEGLIPPINEEVASYMLVGWLETAPLLLNQDKGYTADYLFDTLENFFSLRTGS